MMIRQDASSNQTYEDHGSHLAPDYRPMSILSVPHESEDNSSIHSDGSMPNSNEKKKRKTFFSFLMPKKKKKDGNSCNVNVQRSNTEIGVHNTGSKPDLSTYDPSPDPIRRLKGTSNRPTSMALTTPDEPVGFRKKRSGHGGKSDNGANGKDSDSSGRRKSGLRFPGFGKKLESSKRLSRSVPCLYEEDAFSSKKGGNVTSLESMKKSQPFAMSSIGEEKSRRKEKHARDRGGSVDTGPSHIDIDRGKRSLEVKNHQKKTKAPQPPIPIVQPNIITNEGPVSLTDVLPPPPLDPPPPDILPCPRPNTTNVGVQTENIILRTPPTPLPIVVYSGYNAEEDPQARRFSEESDCTMEELDLAFESVIAEGEKSLAFEENRSDEGSQQNTGNPAISPNIKTETPKNPNHPGTQENSKMSDNPSRTALKTLDENRSGITAMQMPVVKHESMKERKIKIPTNNPELNKEKSRVVIEKDSTQLLTDNCFSRTPCEYPAGYSTADVSLTRSIVLEREQKDGSKRTITITKLESKDVESSSDSEINDSPRARDIDFITDDVKPLEDQSKEQIPDRISNTIKSEPSDIEFEPIIIREERKTVKSEIPTNKRHSYAGVSESGRSKDASLFKLSAKEPVLEEQEIMQGTVDDHTEQVKLRSRDQRPPRSNRTSLPADYSDFVEANLPKLKQQLATWQSENAQCQRRVASCLKQLEEREEETEEEKVRQIRSADETNESLMEKVELHRRLSGQLERNIEEIMVQISLTESCQDDGTSSSSSRPYPFVATKSLDEALQSPPTSPTMESKVEKTIDKPSRPQPVVRSKPAFYPEPVHIFDSTSPVEKRELQSRPTPPERKSSYGPKVTSKVSEGPRSQRHTLPTVQGLKDIRPNIKPKPRNFTKPQGKSLEFTYESISGKLPPK